MNCENNYDRDFLFNDTFPHFRLPGVLDMSFPRLNRLVELVPSDSLVHVDRCRIVEGVVRRHPRGEGVNNLEVRNYPGCIFLRPCTSLFLEVEISAKFQPSTTLKIQRKFGGNWDLRWPCQAVSDFILRRSRLHLTDRILHHGESRIKKTHCLREHGQLAHDLI